MLPGYSNEVILMVKSTALASTITMMEVTGLAAKLISATYRPSRSSSAPARSISPEFRHHQNLQTAGISA
jgi:ABC-type arginine/histidine transport system permease subunit